MQYTVEIITHASQQEMLNFLKEHENFSLFLLGNFESYGASLTDAPYSGNFKLIRSFGEIVAVFSLIRKGSLQIEATVQEPIFQIVLEACRKESIPLNAIVGNWDFCGPFWEYLKAKKVIQRELYSSKEILYCTELGMQDFPSQPNVRLLTEDDYDQWKPMLLDYLLEQGFPRHLNDSQLQDHFLDKAKRKITWGFFLKDILVSIADLNAKALDLGQVGGVYTAPSFRRRGYSKSVIQQLFFDAKKLHKIRKLIIFTGDENIAAKKLYTSLGATQAGYFALHFGSND